MTRIRLIGPRLAGAALAGLACLAGASAQAQLQMEVRVGFGGTAKPGRWAPLEIALHNPGGARRGEVFARITQGADTTEYEEVERVELPHQGRRTIQFIVPIPEAAGEIAAGIRGEDGRSLAEQNITPDRYRKADALVLALTRSADLDFLPAIRKAGTAVVHVQPEQLPVHWAGYDGVRALVVHNRSLSELEQARFEALVDWVREGGTLVLASGDSYSVLQGPRERGLLPVRVRGMARVRTLPVLPNYPKSPIPAGDWLIADSVPDRGQVVATAEDRPLIARRALGQGDVVFLALDYASSRLWDWPGNPALWELILPPTHDARISDSAAAGAGAGDAHPMALLLKESLLHFPSRWLLAGAVFGYLLLAGAAFWTIRRGWGGGLPGWAGLGAIVLAGGGVSWFWLHEPILASNNTVFSLRTQTVHSGEEQGELVEHAGLFSSRGGTADIRFGEITASARAAVSMGPAPDQAAPQRIRISREGGTLFWRGLVVGPYSTTLISSEGLSASPIALNAEYERGATALVLEHRHGPMVAASLVLQRGVAYETGPLRPQEKRREDFFDVHVKPEDSAGKVADVIAELLPGTIGEFSAAVPRQMVKRYFGERTLADIADRLIWIGWIPGAPVGIQVENDRQHELELTLLIAELLP